VLALAVRLNSLHDPTVENTGFARVGAFDKAVIRVQGGFFRGRKAIRHPAFLLGAAEEAEAPIPRSAENFHSVL
jgi:hypothetical protein